MTASSTPPSPDCPATWTAAHAVEIVTDALLPDRRALIVVDGDPAPPWGDAFAPALLIGLSGRARLAGDVFQPAGGARVADAYERFADPGRFERYLRQWHDTTTVAWLRDGQTTVALFDTGEYRARTGAPHLADDARQWRYWLTGQVYGVILQQRLDLPACPYCGSDQHTLWIKAGAWWDVYGLDEARLLAAYLLGQSAVTDTGLAGDDDRPAAPVDQATAGWWQGLVGPALSRALTHARWFAQPNDLIGGWSVMPVDAPPSSGIPTVADVASESIARHIAAQHNADLAVDADSNRPT
ncbi:hypothetical protein [Actinoplanes flavus]|uniref:Uncharacterized protein n=1 Tax=Actinoplanes flavus TaxID=2820290 RepID=A0ABS3UD13_9ACTN|nr:hypothetical protein [Actinoplanes flavus]MBO3736669.1 hypothetical protein [Actinoplanes flavus]